MKEPTKRFSDRVENYAKYRPSYPTEAIRLLSCHCGLSSQWNVADVGSGTGIFAALLMKTGCKVLAVEPNREMREEAKKSLCEFPNFTSIEGTAESTNIAAHSVDMVTVAQAFHWFDKARTKVEFRRTLKEDGWVVLIWNNRRIESDFEKEYEELIKRYSNEYPKVGHKNQSRQELDRFYAPGCYDVKIFPNCQHFDFAGLRGRLLSSSYTPTEADPVFEPMIAELRTIFEKHKQDGLVPFTYNTEVFFGKLTR